jgi:hypothetical protein
MLIFFTALYVWIGYRGGVLIMLACFFAYLAIVKGRRRLASLFAMGVIVAISSSFLRIDVVGQLIDRYSTLVADESDGVRSGELAYALQSGAQSPVIGKGLGWQVPFDVAFKGIDLSQLGNQAERSSVGYIHSMPAYFFMNLGLIGVFLATAVYLPWGISFSRLRRGELDAAAAVSALNIFLFSLSQASFRNIQAVLLTVALIKILDSSDAEHSAHSRRPAA